MNYIDLAVIEAPAWYGFTSTIKPVFIKADNYNELAKKSRVKGLTVLRHPSDEVFRKAVEKSLVDAVLPDRLRGHDYLHHRRTIIDNITAKLMNKNKVSLLFTFRELLNTHADKRALIWGRMIQEMKICIKKQVPVMLASGAEKTEELLGVTSILAMAELLGLKPDQAKKALSYVQEKITERD